ncbi:MAG: hypothetical protein QXJ75_05375 [Candidatus Bathyarchaeia archaeon]
MNYVERFGILFLVSVLVVASAILPTGANAANTEIQKAERMLETAEKVGEIVDRVFERANQMNLTIPESSIIARDEGDALFAKAQTAYAAGNYTQTRELAFTAMHQYRLALTPLAVLLEEGELTLQSQLRMQEAIRRREQFLFRVQSILERARAAGLNTTSIEERLAVAVEHLNNTRALLAQGYVNTSAKELGRIQSSFAGVVDDIQHLAREHNYKRIVNFTDRQGGLLRNLEKLIGKAEQLNLDTASATSNLEEAREAIEEAQSLIEQGDVDEAIAKVKEARKEINEAFKDLNAQGKQKGGGTHGHHSWKTPHSVQTPFNDLPP